MATGPIRGVLGKARGNGMMPDWIKAWEQTYKAEEAERKEWDSYRDGQPIGDQLALSHCAYHGRRRDYAYERYIAAEKRSRGQ